MKPTTQKWFTRSLIATTVIAAGLGLGVSPAFADVGLTVNPSTSLSDGQVVTVSATGFDAGESVIVGECDAAQRACNTAEWKIGTADANGTVSIQLTARKAYAGVNPATGEARGVDCSVTQCIVGVGSASHPNGASVKISFN
jgi:hypothetical protein